MGGLVPVSDEFEEFYRSYVMTWRLMPEELVPAGIRDDVELMAEVLELIDSGTPPEWAIEFTGIQRGIVRYIPTLPGPDPQPADLGRAEAELLSAGYTL